MFVGRLSALLCSRSGFWHKVRDSKGGEVDEAVGKKKKALETYPLAGDFMRPSISNVPIRKDPCFSTTATAAFWRYNMQV
jgi:hypothetical protein